MNKWTSEQGYKDGKPATRAGGTKESYSKKLSPMTLFPNSVCRNPCSHNFAQPHCLDKSIPANGGHFPLRCREFLQTDAPRPSNHQGCHQRQDGVELREGGVNHRVGHHVMPLRHAGNAVCANLPLADGREQAYQAYAQTNA